MNNTIHAAVAQADDRAGRIGEQCTVYHAPGVDRFGRSDVFYVRSASEGPPPGVPVRVAYQTAQVVPSQG